MTIRYGACGHPIRGQRPCRVCSLTALARTGIIDDAKVPTDDDSDPHSERAAAWMSYRGGREDEANGWRFVLEHHDDVSILADDAILASDITLGALEGPDGYEVVSRTNQRAVELLLAARRRRRVVDTIPLPGTTETQVLELVRGYLAGTHRIENRLRWTNAPENVLADQRIGHTRAEVDVAIARICPPSSRFIRFGHVPKHAAGMIEIDDDLGSGLWTIGPEVPQDLFDAYGRMVPR